MFEALARTDPVSGSAFVGDGVALSLAAPMARFSLRARQPEAIERLLGLKLPRQIGASHDGAACLGPDEWLLRTPAGTALATVTGLPVAITEVSERSVCLIVEGARAAEVLAAGCPLDLDRFALGRVTRTVFETVEIILFRTGDERFEVEVWRSFAPWLWTAVETAAGQLR
jgi:sarcosine oxidase, subunit gamma